MSKKSSILDTTLSLIKDHGFHGTSMSMIACKSGVAMGTIYHHYPSKDELIKALFKEVNENLINATQISLDAAISFKDRFFNFWKSQYIHYVSFPEALIFLEQYMNSPYYEEEEQIYIETRCENISNFFNHGIEKGFIKNMNREILTPVIRGSITATARLHLSGKYTFNDEDLDKIMDIVWSGIKI